MIIDYLLCQFTKAKCVYIKLNTFSNACILLSLELTVTTKTASTNDF